MSDENQVDEIEETPSELETLKARADMMGIQYHPKIGAAKLAQKIENQLAGNSVEDEKAEDISENSMDIEVKANIPKGKQPLTEKEYQANQAITSRRQAGRLIRIRAVCMNPNKKEWEGEIFSVGSAKMGTFKKYVPFNAEQGWHVPYIIYQMMKDRKCSIFVTSKGPKGEKIRVAKQVPEFSIEILDPLTPEELKDLAQKQAMSGSIDE